MDKPISLLMEKHITVVDIDDTVDKVEEILALHKLSCVPVVDSKGNCFGIINTRDLMHFHAMRKNPHAGRAWEVCTHNIIEVSPNICVKEAAKLMLKNKIQHILVVENKFIKGIVSSTDVVREYLLEQNT